VSDRPRLKTLQPRIKELPPRVPTLGQVKRANRTGRDADPRRTLALNTAAWQKLRASVLRESALCEHCLSRSLVQVATDVDHRDGNPGNNSRDNLAALCHPCHSIKTAADHGKQVHQGCDKDGIPTDPAHPWNKGRHGPPGKP
jgi:5-methylcytosine-specific restriction endonuclease McrA